MSLTMLTAHDDGGLGVAVAWALLPLARCACGSTPGLAVVQLPDALERLDEARRLVEAAAGIDDVHREDLRHDLICAGDYARLLSALALCRARHRRTPNSSYERDVSTQFGQIADAAAAALAALDALPSV